MFSKINSCSKGKPNQLGISQILLALDGDVLFVGTHRDENLNTDVSILKMNKSILSVSNKSANHFALKLYTNPGVNELIIEVPHLDQKTKVKILSMSGQTVKEFEIFHSTTIGTNDLAVGPYVVQLLLPDNTIKSKKIMISN